jgi:hypothetical protein
MKKTKIIYWIATALFAGFMIFSAIPEILETKDGAGIITGLGYPAYFVRFIGIAKLLGSIAILIPGLKRLKEWAYAGLFFDLLGATYSAIAVGGFQPEITFMLLPIGFLFLSYYYWHRL